MSKTPHISTKSLSKKHENFALLYKKFALPLMKFLVKKMGGNQEAAEEVFSQTILAAYKGLYTFESRSSFFTWLCRIALNKSADYYRHQINEQSRWVTPALESWAKIKDPHLTPEESAVLLELRDAVKECLNLLPEEKKQLLYLRYWQEMTIKGIAQALGVSERAAEGKLYRAKLAFRAVYSTRYLK